MTQTKRDVILFLGRITHKHIRAVQDVNEHLNKQYRVALLTNRQRKIDPTIKKKLDILIRTNVKRNDTVENALLPIRDQVAAVVSRYEYTMPLYARIIPFFPYLKNPTPRSLMIANDKVEMRKTLKRFAPHVSPRFKIVHDVKKKTLDEIEKDVQFPCIIKPASLSRSQLVLNCYYREELESTLKQAIKKVKALYKTNKVEHEPKLLVEQLIEGDLYSVDVYVNSRGTLYFTPPIELKTGKDIGHDDFFMYSQIAPARLDKDDLEQIKFATAEAIRAFGLRSCTAHVELFKTKKNGVKIIEIGARVGGYRDELLGDAYGIKHSMNDILIRLGEKPVLKVKKKEHTAFLKYWPQQGGTLKSLRGIKKVEAFDFVLRSEVKLKPGQRVGLSKFGYPFVASFHVVADSRSKLLGNIRKLEKTFKIVLEK